MTTPTNRSTGRRWLIRGLVGLAFIFVAAQFVRFVVPGFQLDNPPVTHEVNWDSRETQQLWDQTCADCHSNETDWPFYSYVAPVGWLVAHDTHEGRRELNVSENHNIEVEEMVEVIREGEMPLDIYTVTHPEADLSASEKDQLIAGLQATFGGTTGGGFTGGDEMEDEDEEYED